VCNERHRSASAARSRGRAGGAPEHRRRRIAAGATVVCSGPSRCPRAFSPEALSEEWEVSSMPGSVATVLPSGSPNEKARAAGRALAIEQAYDAFTLFTGLEPSRQVMVAAFGAVMERRPACTRRPERPDPQRTGHRLLGGIR
jgi:hypothetical protein